MALLILSNICFILGLLLVMAFINKLSEKTILDVKRKIIVIIVSLFIVDYIYYFDYDKEDILLLLNILITSGIILLIIISLILAIFKKKRTYFKFILLGILFFSLPFFVTFLLLLQGLPKG